VGLGVDEFPYTQEQLARMRRERNAFVKQALTEGVVLFERVEAVRRS
jgi:hypothetical protein